MRKLPHLKRPPSLESVALGGSDPHRPHRCCPATTRWSSTGRGPALVAAPTGPRDVDVLDDRDQARRHLQHLPGSASVSLPPAPPRTPGTAPARGSPRRLASLAPARTPAPAASAPAQARPGLGSPSSRASRAARPRRRASRSRTRPPAAGSSPAARPPWPSAGRSRPATRPPAAGGQRSRPAAAQSPPATRPDSPSSRRPCQQPTRTHRRCHVTNHHTCHQSLNTYRDPEVMASPRQRPYTRQRAHPDHGGLDPLVSPSPATRRPT